MKNFYFLFLFLGSIWIGCSDNEGNPGGDGIIKYLELPKVDTIWKPEDIIEIYGIGFNNTSRVWLRSPGTLGEDDIAARAINVMPGGIRFVAPDVYGEQEVVLEHEDVKYVLGTLIFIDEPIIPIDGIKLPQIDSIWNPGDIITIEGIGFTEESQIWLRVPGTYGSNGTRADIYSVTAISLSFIAPANVHGEQEVRLIHEGESYTLGNLIFAEEKIIYYISKIIKYEDDEISEEELRYNSQNRIIGITITSWEEGEEEETVVTTVNYEYTGSQIIREDINEGESVFTIYNLNDVGLVDQVTYNETGDEYLFEYNLENQVIKVNDYIINWQDGNIKDIEGEFDYTYNYYTYAWNANLNVSLLVGNFEPLLDKYVFGQGFLGKTNRNLLSRYTLEDTYRCVYEYEFDGEKVIKITEFTLLPSDEREEKKSWIIEYR